MLVAEHIVTKEKVAIKTLERAKLAQQGVQKKIMREISILLKLRHPHIVRIYEAIFQERYIHVVMEYVPGGELFDLINSRGKMSELESLRYFQQLISCLEYCHNRQISHRDLKPENILIGANKCVKLADFGLSNLMRDGRFLLTPCGSPNYAAPEIVSGKAYCGSQIDIWSAGIILFALLTKTLPFDDNNQSMLYHKIREGRFSIPSYLSFEVQDLLRRMIQINPLERITIQEIKVHPWYQANVPFYIRIMDNTKIEMGSPVDVEVFSQVCTVTFVIDLTKF